MTPTGTAVVLLASAIALARPGAARGQAAEPTNDPLAPVHSMGKPLVWKPFAGGYYGLDGTEDDTKSGGGAYFGVYKDLLPSIVGIGASAEGYVGSYSGLAGVNGGVTLSAGVARGVRTLARAKKASASRVIAELVESGLEAQDAARDRFLELAHRLTDSKDPAEQERIKEELARLTFGD